MFDYSRDLPGGSRIVRKLMRLMPSPATIRGRMRLLRWLVPLSLMIMVIAYELGPARWLHHEVGFTYHLVTEIFVFASIGPLLVFLLLDIFWRWLDERDTSDYQAQLLAETRDDAERSRQLTDDAIQALFTAGTLIAMCKSECQGIPPEKMADIEKTEQALAETVEHLRSHLQN